LTVPLPNFSRSPTSPCAASSPLFLASKRVGGRVYPLKRWPRLEYWWGPRLHDRSSLSALARLGMRLLRFVQHCAFLMIVFTCQGGGLWYVFIVTSVVLVTLEHGELPL
jgi:hypothetical protein